MPGYQYRGTQPDTEKPKPEPRPVPRARLVEVPDAPAPAKLPRWEEPPARATGRGAYTATVVQQLKAKPGTWARVRDGLKNGGGASAWRKHGCEAVTRRVGTTWSVWARWPEDTK